jgi:divalent metal cation (Fe/Co/Zn/Cd) transporter
VRVNSPLLQLLGVVVATNFCLACFQRYEAGLLENSALRFSAGHLFQDTWLMLPVLAGLVGVGRGYLWLDPLLAMVLVLAAIGNCWRVFNWQLPSLMRQIAIAPEALAQTIHQVEGITHCYSIQSRGIVGRQVFVEMRLILHPECMSIARSIAERVERAIRDRYGPAKVVIYIDSDRPKSN